MTGSRKERMTIHLDAMNREPEAGTCDAEVDASREVVKEFSKAFNPDGAGAENWGKLDTLLAKARQIAGPGSV